MKITKERLNKVIKEEVEKALEEGFFDRLFGRGKKEPEAAAAPAEPEGPSEEELVAGMKKEAEAIRETIPSVANFVARVINDSYDMIMVPGRPQKGNKSLGKEWDYGIYKMLIDAAPLRKHGIREIFEKYYNSLIDSAIEAFPGEPKFGYSIPNIVKHMEYHKQKAAKLEGSAYQFDRDAAERVKAFQDMVAANKGDSDHLLRRHENVDRKLTKKSLKQAIKEVLKDLNK